MNLTVYSCLPFLRLILDNFILPQCLAFLWWKYFWIFAGFKFQSNLGKSKRFSLKVIFSADLLKHISYINDLVYHISEYQMSIIFLSIRQVSLFRVSDQHYFLQYQMNIIYFLYQTGIAFRVSIFWALIWV